MFKTSQSICHYYNTKKGCKFGTNCTFSHVNIPNSNSTTSNQDETITRNVEPTLPSNSSNYSPVNRKGNDEEPVRNKAKGFPLDCEKNLDISSKGLEEKYEDEIPTQNQSKPCFQYFQNGHCRFGTRCRFSHSVNHSETVKTVYKDGEKKTSKQVKVTKPEPSATTTAHAVNTNDGSDVADKKAKAMVTCRFFITGRCRSGQKCRFYHPHGSEKLGGIAAYQAKNEDERTTRDATHNSDSKSTTTRESDESARPKNPKVNAPSRPPYKKPSAVRRDISRENVSKEIVQKLQSTEIAQLKKRFPEDKLRIIEENDDGNHVYCLSFTPSDPDWPFDVETYELQLTFPTDYPVQMFKAELPTDQDLPETVRRYVEVSICEWLDKKHADLESRGVLELSFRPFIHWLDIQMEEIVTQGLKQLQREMMAKAAGFEFIPASELRERLWGRNSAGSEEEEEGSGSEDSSHTDRNYENVVVYRKKDEEEVYTGPEIRSSDEDNSDDDTPITKEFERANLNDERKGTEIRLRNLQMKETVSTMTYTQIKIIIQCSRCKSNTDLLTPVGRVNLIPCFKCHSEMFLIFRPAIMHAYSSIMGYLDMDGCVPFDLLLQDSAYKLGCMNCNKETKVDSLYPGQPMDVWCKSCHQKLRVAVEDAKFTLLLPTGVDIDTTNVREVAVKKVKRVVKDPVIKLGNPLPDDGTCKHYKKSYRWFRFPCCGKCYPCDLCHEEGEDGHEMILANRMICGHCCREQPFALEKPCISCGHSMTKATTSHWEGGMGCRDKIRMSKNDMQKYANMNKTISRKAAEKQHPNKKKNTKLRHSSA